MKPLTTFLILSIFLVLTFSALADINETEICDPGLNSETVQVCYKNNTGAAQIKVVDSITKLNRINEKPLFLPVENLTFIYEQPLTGTAKNVSIILTLDITSKTITPNFNNFASSLLSGQRLMLIQNGEYYLLEHPRTALFSFANLKLTHIPTLNVYPAVPYPGTESYVFNVLGGRQIELKQSVDGTRVNIRTSALGEAPAAYVIPHNLTEEYEVKFNYNNPVNIIDPASLGTITVCQDDNPRDAEQIKICRNNLYVFTLRQNLLTKQNINSVPSLLLFQIVDGTKQVSLFKLDNINDNGDLDHASLNYDNLIDNMVAGRKLGIEFKNNLYLLSHPVASLIFLPNITLKTYQLAGTTTLTATGSEAQIEFVTLDGGKLYLKRNYDTPPPPFDLWALEQHELAPINLEHQLFTSFSSLGRIQITTPNLGTISIRNTDPLDNDTSRDSGLFKIQASALTSPKINLIYHQPLVKNTSLFYFHSANINQGTPVKTVSIYRYYDLSNGNTDSHYYNDAFITTFTGGNGIALGFSGSYYLLGHDNIPDEPAFFDITKLTLSTLDGTETFEQEQFSASEISFAVPEGAITITTDSINNLIKFKAETTRTLEGYSLLEDDEYSADLTPVNSIKLPAAPFDKRSHGKTFVELQLGPLGGSPVGPLGRSPVEPSTTLLIMCNLENYRSQTAADVCVYDDGTAVQEILIEEYSIGTINGQSYLFQANGEIGDAKVVTVSKILNLSTTKINRVYDWNNFTQNLLNGNAPAFEINNQIYLPVTNNNLLSDFTFQHYPDGEVYALANPQTISPITYNGSFVLNDTIVFAEQGLRGPIDQRVVNTTFSVRPYQYLPDNGAALTVTTSQRFVTSVSGDVYTLTIPNKNQYLAKLSLTDRKNNIIFNRNFASGDSRMLWLDNSLTEITLTGVSPTQANITIQRVME